MIFIDPKERLDDCPAYAIYLPRPHHMKGYPIVHHGDVAMIKGKSKYFQEVEFGSVAGFAVEQGENVIEAIKYAEKCGHKQNWIGLNGTSLTAWERPKQRYAGFYVGDKLIMEGVVYEIAHAPNNNFELVPTGENL